MACHGPIPQAQFLTGLGATERLQGLLEAAQSDAEAEQLISGYKRLVGGASSAGADEQVNGTWSQSGGYCLECTRDGGLYCMPDQHYNGSTFDACRLCIFAG